MSSTQQSAGTYRIDSSTSTAEFTVRAMFGLNRVRGRFAIRSGSVVVGPDGARIAAVLDTASIDTGNDRRDKDLRTARFLDVATYPEMSFTGTGSPVVDSTVAGQLTAHGATAPVDLKIDGFDGIDGIDGRTVRASTRLDRTAFLPGKRGIIGRNVEVALTIRLEP